MSATFGYNQLQFELTGTTANVPNNNLARLMYYLGCVSSVIKCDIPSKLTEYSNYYKLNLDEKKAVFNTAKKYSPDSLNNKVFFNIPELVPSGSSNKFIKITDKTIGFHVSQEILFGGASVKVLEIMVYEYDWLKRNYNDPLRGLNEELIKEINAINQRNTYILINQNHISSYNRANIDSNQSSSIRASKYGSSRNNNLQSNRVTRSNNPVTQYNFINNREACHYCGSNSSPEYSQGFNGARCWCYTILFIYLCPFFLLYLLIMHCSGQDIGCSKSIRKCKNCGHIR